MSCRVAIRFQPLRLVAGWVGVLIASGAAFAADGQPTFYRGLNLNGPAVTIDGHRWDGSDATWYVCNDRAFENQNVPLVPETDVDRTRMIRSSRWGGNRVEITDVPGGTYTLFLYVWEDNNAETFSISVNGRLVAAAHNSGKAGHWERLGPWPVSPKDGKIVLTSQGGAANFSGIELWRGRYDGLGGPLSEEDLTFFERRIRPLLVEKCHACHSAEAKELKGELLVDSRLTLRRGGTSGPAVVSGDPERSLLIQAVRYAKPELQMPPEGKLSDAEIADLTRWVKLGAPDPRGSPTRHVGPPADLAAARSFWSLQPIAAPPVPAVKDTAWPTGDIDRFILAKLEAAGLRPAPDADRRTLLRRVTFDLTGLPPTPDEVAAFLADDSSDAFARVVDRLLASPRYGERWGRHWLDVVRYADTAGDNSDYPIPQMHRYRDWVIGAFNRDQPFDEFVRDQVAGDLRGGANDDERNARVVATGWIANARRFGSRVDDYPQHLTIEDTIDNLGRAFLGMSLACARCHDHKFDPLTTRDYYALYGVFDSTRYPWPGIELEKRQRDFIPLVPPEKRGELMKAQIARTKEQTRLDDDLKKRREEANKAPADKKADLERILKEAEEKNRVHREQPPLFETAYAVADAKSPHDVAIQIKGDPAKPGEVARRGFPAALGGRELPDDVDASGRAELAEWLVGRDNPLTARVVANRLWQHHFGRGIVPTPNDFGRQGQLPSHPELLDFLATRLRDSGWSMKAMHRLILTSRTWRQSSRRDDEAATRDPQHALLAGFPRRRLDAEALRDTLLFTAGNLDLTPAGPHPFPPQDQWDFTQHKPFKAVYETNRRSVFLMTQRIQRHPFLAIFDGADPSTSTAARLTSTTPLQALFLLNDPFVHEQSRFIADRIRARTTDDSGRFAFAYELLFARPATSDEIAAAESFLSDARGLLAREAIKDDEVDAEVWRAWTRTLLRLNEFVYVD